MYNLLHKEEEEVGLFRDREYTKIQSVSTTFYTLVDPKTVFEPYPNPKNSPLGLQKVKNDPKIKSKSNVRI